MLLHRHSEAHRTTIEQAQAQDGLLPRGVAPGNIHQLANYWGTLVPALYSLFGAQNCL